MDDYPKNTWSDKDIDKMKSKYLSGVRDINCPLCEGQMTIEKQEGEAHLKKKYLDTHFFLVFGCKSCGRRDTKTYRKSPHV